MGRRRALVFAVLLSLGGLLAVVMPTAARADQQVPIELHVDPRCDTTAGNWDVYYSVSNWSPADAVIDSLVDPVSGQSFSPVPSTVESGVIATVLRRQVSASTTQLNVRVLLHRVDRTSAIELDTTTPLPAGCVTRPSGSPCVNTDAVRYQHTFDAATATATVKIVGPPLCAGQSELIQMESRTDEPTLFRDAYDQDVYYLDAGHSAVVLHVNLPPCHAHVFVFFDVPYAHLADDPSLTLGASAFPGNRSTGPLADAWLAGPTCHSEASASIASNCDGTMSFHLWNDASANVSTQVKLEENSTNATAGYRDIVLEPGESTVITLTPLHLDGTQLVYWHDNLIAESTYQPSFTCTASRQPLPRGERDPGPSLAPRPQGSYVPGSAPLPRLSPNRTTSHSPSPSPSPSRSPSPSSISPSE